MLTFEQHFAAAAHLAHRLVDATACEKGDRVAIAMRNFPEWSIAFWAAAAAGAVVVPLNAWWTGRRAGVRAERLGRQVVAFVDAERLERLGRALAGAARPRDGRRRAPSEHELAAPAQRFEDVLGDVARRRRAARRRRSSPRTTRRSSTRRARPAGRRARSARTATSATNLMSLAFASARAAARSDAGAGAAPATPRAERVPAVGAVLPRDRLPLGARWPTSRSAGRSCSCTSGTPSARSS